MTTFYVLNTDSGVKVADRVREVDAERRRGNVIYRRGGEEVVHYDFPLFDTRKQADAALREWLEKRERAAYKRWETARNELSMAIWPGMEL